MKSWFSARELAGLPGLPGTDRGIRKMAEREGWEARKKLAGKGWEYALGSLPIEAQAALRGFILVPAPKTLHKPSKQESTSLEAGSPNGDARRLAQQTTPQEDNRGRGHASDTRACAQAILSFASRSRFVEPEEVRAFKTVKRPAFGPRQWAARRILRWLASFFERELEEAGLIRCQHCQRYALRDEPQPMPVEFVLRPSSENRPANCEPIQPRYRFRADRQDEQADQ